jgi:hypothetical protein
MLTSIIPILLSGLIIASPPAPVTDNRDLLVLETKDPIGDQELTCRPDLPYPGGDLKGARLVLRKVPVQRSKKTLTCRPAFIYIPVELTVRLDRDLRDGEVQLCIFIHLPPLQIEHIISRDSFLTGLAPNEERVVLTTQSGISLFTGMEKVWDNEVLAFKNSPVFKSCFFDAAPEARINALREAEQFNIHDEDTYRFPPSPAFYWREIPSLTISTSLVVREMEGLTARGIRELLIDTMTASWVEVDKNDQSNPE